MFFTPAIKKTREKANIRTGDSELPFRNGILQVLAGDDESSQQQKDGYQDYSQLRFITAVVLNVTMKKRGTAPNLRDSDEQLCHSVRFPDLSRLSHR
ncbi:hypothetical protein P7K49_026200 [Saguinus oedipus]|uniref:Uncharacterized protein n=1 Tax=Saguinus oedipus TaxID=9490 RepID=A0ABQ9UCH3_SAGOE|nr:hypothetical protein P7K49_026200 [Saguinus oedipus]